MADSGDNGIKTLIDKGFSLVGTEPEREVLYELMEKIMQSKTGQRLYDLLNTKKKVVLGFYHNSRAGENPNYEGYYSPRLNKISINIRRVRSTEARISTLTHELFHALQFKTKTLHNGFTPEEGKQVFMLNELEARFKCMEILNELYPNADYVAMNLPHLTKIDCIIFRALQEQAQKALMMLGQNSSEIAHKIARRVAKSEMIKSQLFSITPHVASVLGTTWSNEFESMNNEWQQNYRIRSKNEGDLTSIIPFLPIQTKPNLLEIQNMIANRFELPVSVFQNPQTPCQNFPQQPDNKSQRISGIFRNKRCNDKN